MKQLFRSVESQVVLAWFLLRARVTGGTLRVGENARLSWRSSIKLGKGASLFIGDNFLLGDYGLIVVYAGGVMKVGDNVSFTNHDCFYCMKDITVGDNLGLAPYCFVIDYDHDYEKLSKDKRATCYKTAPVVIGSNAWVGAHSVILKGVTLGKQSVVGANTTVSKSVPDYGVAVGGSAKTIKFKVLTEKYLEAF